MHWTKRKLYEYTDADLRADNFTLPAILCNTSKNRRVIYRKSFFVDAFDYNCLRIF